MLNTEQGDGATSDSKVLVSSCRNGPGDRHQNYACPDALTASPHSLSFLYSPPDLPVAVPRDIDGITVQWPSVTGRSFN